MIVQVVFDMENESGPMPLGVYHRTDEDVVIYDAGARGFHAAPEDCVKVVDVYVGPLFGPRETVTSADSPEAIAAYTWRVTTDAAAGRFRKPPAVNGPGFSVRA